MSESVGEVGNTGSTSGTVGQGTWRSKEHVTA